MTAPRVLGWLWAALFLVTAVATPRRGECSSCCPPSTGDGPAFASANCCGEECGDRLQNGEQRPCVNAARADAAKSQALPASINARTTVHLGVCELSDDSVALFPAFAPPGTRPLRL